jgi:hypothetical protein
MFVDRIGPDDVTKDDKGNIHVHISMTRNGESFNAEFFTSKDACGQFVKDDGITPEQAPAGDIN